MPKTVTVSTTKQLVAAAKKAVGGDTILLAAGNYADLVLFSIKPTSAVTIKTASGLNDAIFSSFTVNASSNLSFQNIDVVRPLRPGEPEWARAATVGGSTNINLVGMHFMGSMNNNRNDDGNGLVITDSNRVTVLNSSFEQFNNGAIVSRTNDIVFAGNTITEVREGVNISQVNGGLFERNYVTKVIPDLSKMDHSDAFQLHSGGNAQNSKDVVFRSNVIISDTQAIFVSNGKLAQGSYQQNIVIENNYYEGRGASAIAVYGVKNAVVTGNTLREGDGTSGWAPAIMLGGSTGVTFAANIYARFQSRADWASTDVTFASNNIDVVDRTTGKGVAVASVFSTPTTDTANINFSSLNAVGSQAVNVAGIGFRAVAGIGGQAGTADALLASYVPQFDVNFSAHYFA
jgi:hypothetical protein